MAGGGPTMTFRGQRVPAVALAGRKIPSHVYATVIYGLTAAGIAYSMSGKPKQGLEPALKGINQDENDFVRDFVAQMEREQSESK